MGTKTIGLDDEAYEKLSAEKREGESFSDTVKRITETVASDWRRGFGRYADAEYDDFERAIADSRTRTSDGLSARQRRVNEILRGRDRWIDGEATREEGGEATEESDAEGAGSVEDDEVPR